MATATQTRKTTKKSTTKAAKPAPEEVEDDDLEELDEDEVQEATSKRGSDEVTFGVADVCKLLSKGQDKAVTPRELRQLIRKMAREDNPRVQREITAGNRQRYSWSGPNDPEVQAIVKAYKGGELEADKQAKLAELKANKAKRQAAAPEGKTSKKAGKKAAAPVVEEDDVEELELDDDED